MFNRLTLYVDLVYVHVYARFSFVPSVTSCERLGQLFLQGFKRPHDVTVSNGGRYLYVAEIGPDEVWKFEVSHNATKGRISCLNTVQDL